MNNDFDQKKDRIERSLLISLKYQQLTFKTQI